MFLRWVAQQQEDLKTLWASGQFSAAFETEMIVKNAGATGACSAYQKVLEFDFAVLQELDNE